MVVIWRYSPDSHARPVRTEAGERKGMRKCDDCTIGKECQAGGEEDRPRESELEREREREREYGRDYSAVYSNGQSDPHQSQRAPPNIPDTLV